MKNKLYIYNEDGSRLSYVLRTYAVVNCYDLGIYEVGVGDTVMDFSEYVKTLESIDYSAYSEEPIVILSTCQKHGTDDRSIAVFQRMP